MRQKVERPACPKCGKPMKLVSTGSVIRTFCCTACNKIVTVKR